jgi:hypothetical protein
MARDYAKEYSASRTPERRRANIMRKRARRLMIKRHGEAAVNGKEVDHNNLNPTDNRPSNLSIKSKSANRRKQPRHK